MKTYLKCLRFQGVDWNQRGNNKGPVTVSWGHLASMHSGKYLARQLVFEGGSCHSELLMSSRRLFLVARASCLVLTQQIPYDNRMGKPG
jgi:hypothetical protein